MNCIPKRRRDDADSDTKKTKSFINEKERLEVTTSNEWPIYAHPDGGTVKFTPWGCLRQYVDNSGETVTKFEDMSFQEYMFNSNKNNNIYQFTPSTPQSINQVSMSPSPGELKLSLSDEVENYVINGYQRMTPPPAFPNISNGYQPEQYAQEHENYLGMEQEEEFESTDSIRRDDDEMMM